MLCVMTARNISVLHRRIIGNDNTFIASDFSNNQIGLCKTHIAITEEVCPCILDAYVSAVQNVHASLLMTSYLVRFFFNNKHINSSPFWWCICFCAMFEIDTTAGYLIVLLFIHSVFT